MLESQIEQIAGEYCKSRNILFLKLKVEGQVGFPDRHIIGDGYSFFVEYKQKGKYPTEKQKQIHKKLRSLGCDVFCLDEVGHTARVVDGYMRGQVPSYWIDSNGMTRFVVDC